MTDIIKSDQHQLSTQKLEDEIRAMKDAIMPNASNADLSLFAKYCAKTKLDPFSRQIYAIQRGGRWGFQTSIDGFRVVAERSGRYEGQTPAYWCGPDGKWTDSWISNNPPVGAKIGVYKKGAKDPIWGFARFQSYNQPNNSSWKKMPELMLAKCAEAQALRKAFPNDLSGLYTSDEMDQADNPIKIKEKASDINMDATVAKKEGVQASPLLDGVVLSEKQVKRFWALANVAKITREDILKMLEKKDIKHVKDLSKDAYDVICDRFQEIIDKLKNENAPEITTNDVPWDIRD